MSATPPGDDSAQTQTQSRQGMSGGTIGPYRLLERLGEGGMGEVWLAEQTRPVRRQVALKVIKAGMDTAQVVARFEAERQALALMDHPAIAKVFDAGATDLGRPYFVMEQVRGESLTAYCDRHRLTIRERLELFANVCDGVQHAHQKGIIHRDLKPSNILVTLLDDRPVPKIIDFGVAKAISQPLTEHTLYTSLGGFVGTPEYMSPEQAEAGGVDIDTRTDVYALGVILYELLTGVLPFDRHTLKDKSIDEIRRTIREFDPLRPSTRITQLAAASTDVARTRGAVPSLLRSLLTGGSRLDHDEGAGEGPLAALRHGDRTGERRAAPSAERAGLGRATQRSVPDQEIRAPAPVRRRRGGYVRSAPRRSGRDDDHPGAADRPRTRSRQS